MFAYAAAAWELSYYSFDSLMAQRLGGICLAVRARELFRGAGAGESDEPWDENLRALLVLALGQSRSQLVHVKKLRSYPEANLNQTQQRVVTRFVLCVKDGKCREIS